MPLRASAVPCLLAVLLSLVFAATAAADPADLDSSFATGGVTTVPFSPSGYAESVARQPDGKYVVVGGVPAAGNTYDWGITRVNANGGLDTAYGNSGKQTWTEGGHLTGAADVAVEGNGTIDVVGDNGGSPASIDLFRFNGTNDGTVAGHTLTPITGATDVVGRAVALQPDGKIFVAGTARISNHDRIFLARFNTDSSIDTTFDNDGGTADGIVLVDSAACDGTNGDCAADSLDYVTSGGTVTAIYVGGQAENVDPGARILRFTPASGQNGFALDGAYGSAGILKLPANTLVAARSLLVQDDGKVAALGDVSVASGTKCGAVRRLADGTPDLGFGSSGQVTLESGGELCAISDADLGSDGRITFTGPRVSGSTPAQVLGRLTASGTADETFAAGGLAVAPVGSPSFGDAMELLADGKIVTTGGTGSTESFYVARYQGGVRSTGGGGGGTTTTPPPGGGATTPPPSDGAAPEAPRPLTPVSYRSNTDGSPLAKAGPNTAIACDPGTWAGNPGFSYAWTGIPRNGTAETISSSRVYFLDAAAAKKYEFVGCEVYATNAVGARLVRGTFVPTVMQIAMPDVAGLSVPEAKRTISDALGNVVFDKVTLADGTAKKNILCEFGGTKPYVD